MSDLENDMIIDGTRGEGLKCHVLCHSKTEAFDDQAFRNPSTAFYQAFHLNTFQESKNLWDRTKPRSSFMIPETFKFGKVQALGEAGVAKEQNRIWNSASEEECDIIMIESRKFKSCDALTWLEDVSKNQEKFLNSYVENTCSKMPISNDKVIYMSMGFGKISHSSSVTHSPPLKKSNLPVTHYHLPTPTCSKLSTPVILGIFFVLGASVHLSLAFVLRGEQKKGKVVKIASGGGGVAIDNKIEQAMDLNHNK
ncbi:hypothetical protein HPG69_007979 [Diceros bicornis minor]|uniref:Uncharacterized protein n=1 Tax=Diceros bicornis minor TaxID=77932 RepID=A0A7J7EFW9_DICBM|nr:hypothetical protein HPG69_007979 [Diceros bicornis minor]